MFYCIGQDKFNIRKNDNVTLKHIKVLQKRMFKKIRRFSGLIKKFSNQVWTPSKFILPVTLPLVC